MAIILEVQPYCGTCLDFEADVTRPARYECIEGEFTLGDTYVRCRYAKRCKNLVNFLGRQNKEEE
jgi:hypothetical protein